MEQHPYFIVPDVERYRLLDPKSEEAKVLRRKIAANIGDYASLRIVLGIDPEEFGHFYPDMETSSPSTFDTIDSFLDKYSPGPLPQGLQGLEANIGGGVADISSFGADIEPSADISGGATDISSFGADIEPEADIGSREEISLSLLLKEKRYEEALKFIEAQNLNNPQKNIYFALQTRFIRKLMALDKHRKQTKK